MQPQHIPTSYPVVVSQAPAVGPVIMNATPNQVKVDRKSTRGLGISNMAIGILSIVIGIAVIVDGRNEHDFKDYGWSGIAGIIIGIWALITGVIGVKSSASVNSACYNWLSMSFNIVICVLTPITAIIFAAVLGEISNCRRVYVYDHYSWSTYGARGHWYCDDRDVGKGCIITLLVLHGIEFFVALAASILCCTAGCSTCCRYQSPPAVIYQQQPYIATSSAPMYVSSTTVPMSSVNYPVSQAAYPNQPVVTQAMYASTNVTYSTEEPPQYQEKERLDVSMNQ